MEMAYDPIKHTEIEVGKINIFKCQRALYLPNAKKDGQKLKRMQTETNLTEINKLKC